MNIGQKLKNTRMAAGLTQESVAEKIGVSRQTISNWENDKSYPDIINVIALSNLYSISLDELLKEDLKMVEYLQESTDIVKSKQKLSRLVLIIAYLVIWALSIVVFWLGGNQDAMGYSLVIFYFVLPISTLIISVFIGKGDGWTNVKWLMLLFFGIMNTLAPYFTFSLCNMIAFKKFNMPDAAGFLSGIICAAIGMAIGSMIKAAAKKKLDCSQNSTSK
ncbi:helix-turn-helix domain-containing protein [Lacrimispora sp.]|uniref:helix-turn-helix domain-containing protein n=1 Tax=Lacrimispora sp. TaxID=2719234 RepID=UPI002FD9FF9B